MPKRVSEDAHVKGHDERNFASLIFIPAARRMLDNQLVLERKRIGPDGRQQKITLRGMDSIGVPRGTDNDLLVTLINMYIEAGCPSDGTIVTTAYELLKNSRAGFGGANYANLDSALKRLHTANFELSNAWFEVPKRSVMKATSFSIISGYERIYVTEGVEQDTALASSEKLVITLNDKITQSIQAGYYKPLDMSFYYSLTENAARALYRHLDAQLDALRLAKKVGPYEYTTDLLELAATLGLTSDRTDALRRSVARMVDELVNKSYLTGADYIGKGKKMRLVFRFAEREDAVDPELLQTLVGFGVSMGAATKQLRRLGADTVRGVLKRFREVSPSAVKDQGSYLAKMLMNTEPAPAAPPALPEKKAAVRAATSPLPEQPILGEPDWQGEVEPAQAAEFLFTRFHTERLQAQGLTAEETTALKEKLLRREIPPRIVRDLVMAGLKSGDGTRKIRAFL
ncbi:replication initiator protein A [Deinococcus antarcticus]|uniref:Replication initiator protein A n=1 Tax=Deinococcus antarcticus TaxID=1298767 RepID=A0ABV8AD00_9DEIO